MPTPVTAQPATDTAATYFAPHYTAGFAADSDTAVAATASSATSLPVMTVPEAGSATPHQQSLIGNSGVMAMWLAGIFFVVLSYRTGYKYVRRLWYYMFTVRERQNLFEDHTLNETRILTALVVNCCVQLGIAIFAGARLWAGIAPPATTTAMMLMVGAMATLALTFYLLQLALYNLLGYVFSTPVMTKLWTDGFKACFSLLGLLLVPVVALMIASPEWANEMLICATFLYFSARIVFICKGFRIFYGKLPSLVYFILYLCSVEVVPVVLFVASATSILRLLQSFMVGNL